jgi:hypothetical protein
VNGGRGSGRGGLLLASGRCWAKKVSLCVRKEKGRKSNSQENNVEFYGAEGPGLD